jgi:DNA transposition AAA+ family ATPase
MIRKRNRTRPLLSLQERLSKYAQDARAAAKALPPGAERHDLLLKARQGEAAANIDRWLSTPGLVEK